LLEIELGDGKQDIGSAEDAEEAGLVTKVAQFGHSAEQREAGPFVFGAGIRSSDPPYDRERRAQCCSQNNVFQAVGLKH
jgi:hypothetical protein